MGRLVRLSPGECWRRAVDDSHILRRAKIGRASRWHSSQQGQARTPERVGDFLAARLWSMVAFFCSTRREERADRLLWEASLSFIRELATLESKAPVLFRFSQTGGELELVEQAHLQLDAYAAAFHVPLTISLVDEWRSQFQREREERVRFYRRFVKGEEGSNAPLPAQLYWWLIGNMEKLGRTPRLLAQLAQDMNANAAEKDEHQYCLELLTLLKHGCVSHCGRLLASESGVMEAAYARLTHHSGLLVVNIPSWFVSPIEVVSNKWRGAFVRVEHAPVGDTEEAFLRQVSQWADVNHPHVVKLFGACHVGKRFYAHEFAVPHNGNGFKWRTIYQCALGLQYLYERGMAYRDFSRASVFVASMSGHKVMLHGSGIVSAGPEYGAGSEADGATPETGALSSIKSDLRALADFAVFSHESSR